MPKEDWGRREGKTRGQEAPSNPIVDRLGGKQCRLGMETGFLGRPFSPSSLRGLGFFSF